MNGAQRNPNAYVHLKKIVLLLVEVDEMLMYMDVGHRLAIHGVSPKVAAFVALMMKIVLLRILDNDNVVEAVPLRMIVPVMLEFGTQGMLGVVLNAIAVVVTLSIKIVNAIPIVTKLRLFVDDKDTVLESRKRIIHNVPFVRI